MALVEVSTQQAMATNKTLKEAKAKLNTKIVALQQENQVLREAQNDPVNPEMEENDLNDDATHLEVEQPKLKTLVTH